MQTFYYVHTGHRIGLDRFRRAATIIRSLGDVDITLLCSDFRIAQIARDFGVEKSVGIDVVRNIPQISHHGDQLIFDSDEANPIMLDDMQSYFSTFIHIKANEVVIDEKYFQPIPKNIKLSFFFGDDDYEKDMQKLIPTLKELNAEILLGFYYFLDYEDMLKEEFSKCHEFEEYDDVIKGSEIFITSSPQAVLENLASGGKPIYLQREDYITDFNEIFNSLNVPVVENLDINQVSEIVKTIDNRKYEIPLQNSNIISKFIKENLTL